jgi:hypothetical protein
MSRQMVRSPRKPMFTGAETAQPPRRDFQDRVNVKPFQPRVPVRAREVRAEAKPGQKKKW